MRVGILGGGYIGWALAEAASKAHHFVVVYDKKPDRCFWRRSGAEPLIVPSDMALDTLTKSQVFIICLNTPVEGPELVEEAVRLAAGEAVKSLHHWFHRSLFIIESSVPPGFTERMAEKYHLSERFHVAHSPERLWPGHEKEWPLVKIPKLVGGIGGKATREVAKFYRTFMEAPVHEFPSPAITEFAKLYENCQRVVNIAWANEAQELAKRLEVNFTLVQAACGSKPFGYQPYLPGEAGGTCLPANAIYLAKELGDNSLLYRAMGKAGIPSVMAPVYYGQYPGKPEGVYEYPNRPWCHPKEGAISK